MRLFYLRDTNKFPVACVISERFKDYRVRFAVSTHNPVDRYSKLDARNVAAIRLLTGKHWETPIITPRGATKVGVVSIIADPDNNFPLRARAAAKLWLETHTTKTEEHSAQEHKG